MKITTLILLALTLFTFAKKNPYTTEGTDEYESITRYIEGTWDIKEASGFLPKGQMGTKFTEGVIEFQTAPRKKSNGNYVLRLRLSEDLIKERVSHYGESDAERSEVLVDEYWIVAEEGWYVTTKGMLVIHDANVFIPQITGKGENISSFVSKEASLIGATSQEKSYGGFGGMITATIVQSSSEVDKVIPELDHFSGTVTVGDGTITVVNGSRKVMLSK